MTAGPVRHEIYPGGRLAFLLSAGTIARRMTKTPPIIDFVYSLAAGAGGLVLCWMAAGPGALLLLPAIAVAREMVTSAGMLGAKVAVLDNALCARRGYKTNLAGQRFPMTAEEREAALSRAMSARFPWVRRQLARRAPDLAARIAATQVAPRAHRVPLRDTPEYAPQEGAGRLGQAIRLYLTRPIEASSLVLGDPVNPFVPRHVALNQEIATAVGGRGIMPARLGGRVYGIDERVRMVTTALAEARGDRKVLDYAARVLPRASEPALQALAPSRSGLG